MTTAQIATLKADILSRPNLWANGTQQIGNEEVAAFYNSTASPVVNVWKPEVTVQELNSAIAWSDMVLLTQEKQLTYQSMIWNFKIDMTDAQVRSGIDTIFGNPSSSRTGILNVGKRSATYFEALFATGGATKISSLFGYQLSPAEVSAAINS
jgi:hypothetical protein